MTQKQFERGLSAALIVIALAFFAVESQAQTPATLLPQPKMQFLTDGGLVCNGCKVYTYAAGTTTPLATYTSASGAVTNANPVILDSAGRADIWFTNLSYKVKLTTSADALIWSVDNVSSFCTVTGCLMTGQLSITGSAGISVSGSMGTAGTFQTTSSAGTGLYAASTSTSGSTIGVEARSSSTNGTALKLWNLGAGGNSISSYNAAGTIINFSVTNTGVVAANSLSLNNGTALSTTDHTGTGNLVLATSPTIAGPTITSPIVNTSLCNTGTAIQCKRLTAASVCSTPAAVGSVCVTTITWPVAFADTSYTASCMVDASTGTGIPVVAYYDTKAAGSIRVGIAALTAVAANGGLNCIAVHD